MRNSKKTTKKLLSITIALAMIMTLGSAYQRTIKADAVNQNKGIKIDEKNFPDINIRESLAYTDKNKDGYLSKKECDSKTILTIIEGELYGEDPYYYNKKYSKEEVKKRFGEANLKGIENFKNIEEVKIIVNMKGEVFNFRKLAQLPKLKKIELQGVTNIKKYNFKGFKKLEKLYIKYCINVNNIKFDKNSKIKKLNMSSTESKGTINLSSLKKLKSFTSDFTRLKKIKFGKKNISLKYVNICGGEDTSNKRITSLDFSKLKNLKKLDLNQMYNLKTVKLGKKTKLTSLYICASKKLKKVNLNGCKKLNKHNTFIYRTLKNRR